MSQEAKIKTTQREVTQLVELQSGVKITNMIRLLKLRPSEAQETAKQQLTALANRQRDIQKRQRLEG